MKKQIIYVSGLPRSGSTLVCQLLGEHPDVDNSIHSSPLANSVNVIRNKIGNNNFFLAQMDVDPEKSYNKLKNSIRGFIDGWVSDSEYDFVVDKSRGWMESIETLHHLDPDFKMVVCIRNLVDIFASVEQKHRDTILLPFPDDMTSNHIRGRMSMLFGPGGVIGNPLSAISNSEDIPNSDAMNNVFYVAYEALMEDAESVMNQVYDFIGLEEFKLDTSNLSVLPHESDSYYRMKYPHKTYSEIKPSFHDAKEVSPRIVSEIINGNRWFYERFYPGILKAFDSK